MSHKITSTIAPCDYKMIKKLVSEGRYRSISHFVTIAVQNLVEEESRKRELDEKAIETLKEVFDF